MQRVWAPRRSVVGSSRPGEQRLFLLLLVAVSPGASCPTGVPRRTRPARRGTPSTGRRRRRDRCGTAFQRSISDRIAALVGSQSVEVASFCASLMSSCLAERCPPRCASSERSARRAAAERVAGCGEPRPQRLVGLAVDPADRLPLFDDRLQPVTGCLPRRGPWRRLAFTGGQRLLAHAGPVGSATGDQLAHQASLAHTGLAPHQDHGRSVVVTRLQGCPARDMKPLDTAHKGPGSPRGRPSRRDYPPRPAGEERSASAASATK